MPSYDYRCPANEGVFEVRHGVKETLNDWGELCAHLEIEVGRTPADAPVFKLIRSAPAIASVPTNAELRDAGFRKLVRRDKGVYEDVTRPRNDR